ncbi:MAG: hypothetical protein JWM68_4077 [Verrucomicrobiales bacterium]|nr:hypothetical protein [Verrucomicrobiales bacterium]
MSSSETVSTHPSVNLAIFINDVSVKLSVKLPVKAVKELQKIVMSYTEFH